MTAKQLKGLKRSIQKKEKRLETIEGMYAPCNTESNDFLGPHHSEIL